MSEYSAPNHALAYLARAGQLPHRAEGEAVLLELLPRETRHVLDLGTGDGRLLAIVKQAYPQAHGLALDFSPTMLAAVRERFAGDPTVAVIEHDLNQSLPELGPFDAVVSSLAIHHLAPTRQYQLYEEVFARLEPGGVFCNLEHVSSPNVALHEAFYNAIGRSVADEDESNHLVSVDMHLDWLGRIGYADADCFWKWRELALVAGTRPS